MERRDLNVLGELYMRREILDQPRSPFDELLRASKRIGGIYEDPIRSALDQLRSPFDQLQQAAKRIGGIYEDPIRETLRRIRPLSSELSEFQRSLDSGAFSVQLAGIGAALSGLDVDTSESADIKDVAASAWPSRAADGRIDIQEVHAALLHLIREVTALRASVPDKVLWQVVFPLLLLVIGALINPIVDHYVRLNLPQQRQVRIDAAEALLKQAPSSAQHLQNIRLVATDGVRLRSGWNRGSRVITVLHAGQVVVVLKKRGRQSLVSFSSERQGDLGYGWVLSKRLRRVSFQ